MARRRSPWGSVRKLPSGRYQCRYRVDGVEYTAPETFRTQREADAHLAQIRVDLARSSWVDPLAGRVILEEYAGRWLAERPSLRPRTRELYEGELRLHVLPVLGGVELADLSTSRVRSWHAGLLNAGRPGPSTVAKCYRLLRTILGTDARAHLGATPMCADLHICGFWLVPAVVRNDYGSTAWFVREGTRRRPRRLSHTASSAPRPA